MATAQFPGQQWNGLSPSRSTAGEYAAPDAFDWDQLVAEVQAIHTALLSGLDGSNLLPKATNNILGAVPVVHQITIADSSGDTTVVVTDKTLVLDVWTLKTTTNGGSGDTVTVKNGSTAITDAISLNHNTKSITRAATLDPAQTTLAAGASLTVTAAKSTSVACLVFVLGIRTP
jgi:hypothetical protein